MADYEMPDRLKRFFDDMKDLKWALEDAYREIEKLTDEKNSLIERLRNQRKENALLSEHLQKLREKS